MVIFFYTQIVKAVVAHESALKAQAKKMNVDSLRSNQVRTFHICRGIIMGTKWAQKCQKSAKKEPKFDFLVGSLSP